MIQYDIMKTIVAATKNKHKIVEIEAILKDFGMHIITRDEAGVPGDFEVEENGTTFEENSYLKASQIMKICGEITIADDSGLVVDCLQGAPGVYSARFAAFPGIWPEEGDPGDDSDDGENNRKLQRLIEDIPYEERTARFVSVITMVFPDGSSIVARGEVEGHLLTEERGSCGFGYDPMFVPEGYDRTFGELSGEIKNRISHRAKALAALRKKLDEIG